MSSLSVRATTKASCYHGASFRSAPSPPQLTGATRTRPPGRRMIQREKCYSTAARVANSTSTLPKSRLAATIIVSLRKSNVWKRHVSKRFFSEQRRTKTITASESANTTTANPFMRLLQWYSNLLDGPYALLTKAITSGTIVGTGDLICQTILLHTTTDSDKDKDSPKERDWQRTSRFAFLGFALVAPATHYWYNFLGQRLVPYLLPGSSSSWTKMAQGVLQTAVDQFCFAPVFTSTFLASLKTLEGSTPTQTWHFLRDNIFTIVSAGWCLWIPAQALNFSLVPRKFRVLFANWVALHWNIYLSFQTRKQQEQKKQQEDCEPTKMKTRTTS